MSSSGSQVKNGKAFEYAIAQQYYDFLSAHGRNVELIKNDAYATAKGYFESFTQTEKERFEKSAYGTIDTMIKIEPGLTAEVDKLEIILNEDSAGEQGDVRDIVFKRRDWEIGFSAKNNNDAVKHSRLGKELDFGKMWFGLNCSQEYWHDVSPIFAYVEDMISQGKKWSDLGSDKIDKIYIPLLEAFRKEILYLCSHKTNLPTLLITYLIGKRPFYKVIKDDEHNLVIVKAFNTSGKLNCDYAGVKSQYKVPKVNLPTRIIEFEFKPQSTTTMIMVLDKGWEISFRIHNASTLVERSLKFDIQLLGNPPVLFTQHIFQ